MAAPVSEEEMDDEKKLKNRVYDGKRGKTGIEYSFLLLPPAKRILEKYNGRLPIISNASDALELYSQNPRLRQQFELDLLANYIYARYSSMEQGCEWKIPPVKVK